MTMKQLAVLILTLAASIPATAQPMIADPSFETSTDLREDARAEDISTGKKPQDRRWMAIAWGADKATTKACKIVAVPDAPSGKRVARIHNEINQITVFAQSLDMKQLVPGRWYEVSAKIKCEDLTGQGAFLNVEYWVKGYSCGSIDSEHLVGTAGWTPAVVRFQAPAKDYNMNLTFWALGGPGKAYVDDFKIRPIDRPAFDNTKRRVLDGPFWGMFTCFVNYLDQYGQDMKEAGVYWQRQGTSALGQQEKAKELGMVFEMCLDGMPAAKDRNDPCWPVTYWPDYEKWLNSFLANVGPAIRVVEVFNEPNTNPGWTLAAYANLLIRAGKTIKAAKPDVCFATGGFTSPQIGYTEACLKRGADKYLDIVLIHPYAVDEALDTQLFELGEACARAGRPDLAIAINETGFPTWDPATKHVVNEWFVSEKDQAIKVVKLHVQALAHKCSFVTYLGWNDFEPEPSDQAKNMGLVRVDGSPKPACHAYRFMTKTIGARRIAEWTYQGTGTRIYRFTGEKPMWVVWNALKDAAVTVDTGKTQVFPCDIMGTKLTVKPVSGKVELKAGYEPVYLVPAE